MSVPKYEKNPPAPVEMRTCALLLDESTKEMPHVFDHEFKYFSTLFLKSLRDLSMNRTVNLRVAGPQYFCTNTAIRKGSSTAKSPPATAVGPNAMALAGFTFAAVFAA